MNLHTLESYEEITPIGLNEMPFIDFHNLLIIYVFVVLYFTEESVQRYDDALKKKPDENLLLRSSI